MKYLLNMLLFILTIYCSNDDILTAKDIVENIIITIKVNNGPADALSENIIELEIPTSYSAIDTISVYNAALLPEEIEITFNNEENKRIARVPIKSNVNGLYDIQFSLNFNNSNGKFNQQIEFSKALPNDIQILTNSIQICPNSFGELLINTNCTRESGILQKDIEVETIIIDPNGITHGILIDYHNLTDSLGIIKNRFTMGNDGYTGLLYVISELSNSNTIVRNTLEIYSQ